MALTEQANGQLTADGTEQTLSTRTDGKTYILGIDLGNMALGDITIVRIKTKVRSSSTAALAYSATYAHAQDEPVVYSVPVPAVHSVAFTVEQTDGTNRNYDWSVVSLD